MIDKFDIFGELPEPIYLDAKFKKGDIVTYKPNHANYFNGSEYIIMSVDKWWKSLDEEDYDYHYFIQHKSKGFGHGNVIERNIELSKRIEREHKLNKLLDESN